MYKAICSRVQILDQTNPIAIEYYSYIKSLLEIEEVQMLDSYSQHCNTSRLQHSINVSYYTYFICKKLGYDYESAAKAGLLHDFFLYDWKDKDDRPRDGKHVELHPQIALETARKFTSVNRIMEDCIVHHMWPMTLKRPKTKEGWVLQVVDKYCALLEISKQGLSYVRPQRYSYYAIAFLAFITRQLY